jgi:hypothetical protein
MLNEIKIYTISISICAVFLSLLINSSHAQSSDKFLTYMDNDRGFTIQYPPNWQVEDDPEGVLFQIPDRDESVLGSFFLVSVEEPESYPNTDTMTLKNTSLQQRVQRSLNTALSTHNLLRQNEVTVGGNIGIKTELSMPLNYQFHIGTIANGKFYNLEYSEDPLKVPESLPLANKMVESFQIITE